MSNTPSPSQAQRVQLDSMLQSDYPTSNTCSRSVPSTSMPPPCESRTTGLNVSRITLAQLLMHENPTLEINWDTRTTTLTTVRHYELGRPASAPTGSAPPPYIAPLNAAADVLAPALLTEASSNNDVPCAQHGCSPSEAGRDARSIPPLPRRSTLLRDAAARAQSVVAQSARPEGAVQSEIVEPPSSAAPASGLAPESDVVMAPESINDPTTAATQPEAAGVHAPDPSPIPSFVQVLQTLLTGNADPGPSQVDASATSGDVAPKAEIDRTGSILRLEKGQRKIKNQETSTRWLLTRAPYCLEQPRIPDPEPRRNTVYVHRHDKGAQLWIWKRGRRDGGEAGWTRIRYGHPHPYLRGYVLRINGKGEPGWVTEEYAKQQTALKKRDRAQGRV